MALKGKKPDAIKKRLKVLFYGPPNSGKTTAALQFPRPYVIDTERGAENEQYVRLMNESGAAYFPSTDADEIIAEVTSLLTTKHDYRTLVIDPLTVIYNDLCDKSADRNGTEFGRHKVEADRKIKHLLTLLLRLDMNVIITSHAKDKWVRTKDAKGKEVVVQEGTTFDCYGKLDYLFDLVIRLEKRGKERVGVVAKTRLDAFPEGDVFPFTYDQIADRYGRDVLEADAKPQSLVTKENAALLRKLIKVVSISEETVSKWLSKADSDSIEELPADVAEKCIAHCKEKVETQTVEPVS